MADTQKYLAMGYHGPIDPATQTGRGEAGLEWIAAQLDSGYLDCLYSMEGGGRMLIANAESKEALLEVLEQAPDAKREWKITTLFDGAEVIRRYYAELEAGRAG